eukprot:PITA_02943
MWYGHIPSVRHLKVFGSTRYALITKEQRNKLDERSCKCILLAYLNTSKAYALYDELNNKFIISRDVIFLESSKIDNVVERQLDCLDRFRHAKYFQEFDNELPHLEGGIPILDQFVEYYSKALSPPHEAPTIDDILSDVIDKISRLDLDSTPTQSTKQPGPSQKGPPQWLTKILESVHPDEIQKEYDALIKNGTWKLVDPPLRTKRIGKKWVYENMYKADASLKKKKSRLVAKGFAQKEGVDYEENFPPITKWSTIQTLFALAAHKSWKVHQMDVKYALLNGDMKDNVFMSQPERFVVKGQEHKI